MISAPTIFDRGVKLQLEKQLRMGDQHGFFQNIKSVQLEETNKVESQCVRDEGRRLLGDKGRIRERWVRLFRSLLNDKSDMLDPDIPKRLPQQLVASALGIEPTAEEIATAMKAMANDKAVGPDGLPAELLKLGLPAELLKIEAAGQTYKQVQPFTYLGGAVTEVPDRAPRILDAHQAVPTGDLRPTESRALPQDPNG